MSKIIGIIGTRRRNTTKDFKLVYDKFFELYEEGDIICSGGCSEGGDHFAYIIHKDNAIPYIEFPANWKKYGKKAGFIRNLNIAEWSDILIACVAEDRTGGTEDTINQFKKLNMHKIRKKEIIYIV